MKQVKIYILIDPIDHKVKYVGKTITPLNQRLSNHISSALYRRNINKASNWILSLYNKGLKPKIQEIDSTDDLIDWEWLEIYWISQFKAWGFQLKNMTDGGNGNKNQYFSKESQLKKASIIKRNVKKGIINYKERGLKISKALTGIKRSEQTKEKVRQANIGKKYSMEIVLKKSKCVYQLDLENNILREWYSLNEASRQLKISKGAMSNVCNGRQKSAGGYKWMYKNKDIV